MSDGDHFAMARHCTAPPATPVECQQENGGSGEGGARTTDGQVEIHSRPARHQSSLSLMPKQTAVRVRMDIPLFLFLFCPLSATTISARACIWPAPRAIWRPRSCSSMREVRKENHSAGLSVSAVAATHRALSASAWPTVWLSFFLSLPASSSFPVRPSVRPPLSPADPNAKDRFGSTPLDDASRASHPDLVAFLRTKGAKHGGLDKLHAKLIEHCAKGEMAQARMLLAKDKDGNTLTGSAGITPNWSLTQNHHAGQCSDWPFCSFAL